MNKVMTGCVIGVKRELFERYCQLHDQQPQEIRDLLKQYGFTKLSIFAGEMPAKYMLLPEAATTEPRSPKCRQP